MKLDTRAVVPDETLVIEHILSVPFNAQDARGGCLEAVYPGGQVQ
jgi:hypothetical protein